jgi:hypothetical protein
MASETSVRVSLEAARQSAEDRAISTETAAVAAAVTVRDSLASRLALAEAEIEKLRVATASAEEVAEKAKTAAATAESAARETSQTAAHEKASLEAKVSEMDEQLEDGYDGLGDDELSIFKPQTSFKWLPRKPCGFRAPTPSCRRISRVSRTVPRFFFISVSASCRGLT